MNKRNDYSKKKWVQCSCEHLTTTVLRHRKNAMNLSFNGNFADKNFTCFSIEKLTLNLFRND